MSRYRPRGDGTIEFVAGEKSLVLELVSARAMLLDVRRFAARSTNSISRNGYKAWADDLEAAINVAGGGDHDGQHQTGA